jgi:hypothetical protein
LGGEVNAMTARPLARGFSTVAFHAALMITMTCTVVGVAGADELRRVRPQSARIADAIAQGVESSATFRRLVESIDATDGLVFVAEGKCQHGTRGCLLMSVVIAGSHRILRIFIDPRRAPGCELVEVIGHELQHAVEVLSNAAIRSGIQMYRFFDRVKNNGDVKRFETAAARQTSLSVAREACRRS